MQLALKIDVDTYRGTLQGVPRLVDLLRRNRAGASFMFSLGPDNTGQRIRQIFRPGFMAAAKRLSAVDHYGLKALTYGTIVPAPDIGKGCADIMKSTRDAGFETGIHGWDRVKWQNSIVSATPEQTEIDMRRAHERYVSIFGETAAGHAAAGWQMNTTALRLTQRLGYRWASDCRGTHPFMPVWNGEPVHCPQLPTTLPTLDELIGLDGVTADNVHERLLQLTSSPAASGHVFTLRAELEGLKFSPVFERLLTGWREQGYELVSLGQLREQLVPGNLPRHELIRGTVPGRAEDLMMQGEQFLSTWKDAA